MPPLAEIRLKIPRELMLQVKKHAKDDQRTVANWFYVILVNELAKRESSHSQEKLNAD